MEVLLSRVLSFSPWVRESHPSSRARRWSSTLSPCNLSREVRRFNCRAEVSPQHLSSGIAASENHQKRRIEKTIRKETHRNERMPTHRESKPSIDDSNQAPRAQLCLTKAIPGWGGFLQTLIFGNRLQSRKSNLQHRYNTSAYQARPPPIPWIEPPTPPCTVSVTTIPCHF